MKFKAGTDLRHDLFRTPAQYLFTSLYCYLMCELLQDGFPVQHNDGSKLSLYPYSSSFTNDRERDFLCPGASSKWVSHWLNTLNQPLGLKECHALNGLELGCLKQQLWEQRRQGKTWICIAFANFSGINDSTIANMVRGRERIKKKTMKNASNNVKEKEEVAIWKYWGKNNTFSWWYATEVSPLDKMTKLQ